MRKKLIILALILVFSITACGKKDDDYEIGTISKPNEQKQDKDTNTLEEETNALESELETNNDTLAETKEEITETQVEIINPMPSMDDFDKEPSKNANNLELQQIGSQLTRLLTVDASYSTFEKRLVQFNKLNVKYNEDEIIEPWRYSGINKNDVFASHSGAYNIKDNTIEIYVSPVIMTVPNGITRQTALRDLRKYAKSGEAKEFNRKVAVFSYKKDGDTYEIKLENKWWLE